MNDKMKTARQIKKLSQAELAKLIGAADKSRIVFTGGATESANMAIKGLLKPGDQVVVSGLEHNAVWRPLKQMEAERGVQLTVIPTDRWGYVQAADFARAITDKTRLIVCSMAGNVSGAVQPIAEIGRIAKERGIPLLVDAAQAAGWLPIDVQKQHISLLLLAAH
jgi:selenocysteine lyase/cysteine desulfurase